MPPGLATKELVSQSSRPLRLNPFSSFSPMLNNVLALSPRKARLPVGVAIFEDVREVLNEYVTRFERLQGISIMCSSTVCSADEAIHFFRRSRPSIVITDLSLGEKANTDGFAILRFIKTYSPRTAVALSTLHSVDSTTDIEAEIKKQPFDAVFHKTDFDGISAFITRKVGEFQRAPLEHCICFR